MGLRLSANEFGKTTELLRLRPEKYRVWITEWFVPILVEESKLHTAMHYPLSQIYQALAEFYHLYTSPLAPATHTHDTTPTRHRGINSLFCARSAKKQHFRLEQIRSLLGALP